MLKKKSFRSVCCRHKIIALTPKSVTSLYVYSPYYYSLSGVVIMCHTEKVVSWFWLKAEFYLLGLKRSSVARVGQTGRLPHIFQE